MLREAVDEQLDASADGAIATQADTDFVPVLLSLAKRVRALLGLKLAESGMHIGQDQLLQVLDPDEALDVSAVAARLDIRTSTASKMIDRLEAKGLVFRVRDNCDARRMRIGLTPAGLEMRARVRAIWNDLEAETAKMLGDLEPMRKELRNLDRCLEERLSRLR